MPVGFMTLRTATPPELEELRDDPEGYRQYVSDVVERANAHLVELYFDIGAELAYAIVEDLDDYKDVKAVSRILGAEGFIKMVKAPDAAEAFSRIPTFRGDSGSSA
jgi:hypothetical protein